MQVLAIVDAAPGAQMESVRAGLADELKGAWALYAQGVLREAYATATPTRVVFVLETENADSAAAELHKLPLVAAGLFRCEMIELRPFVNWSRLFA